jgi:quinol monooxygenase YgiN
MVLVVFGRFHAKEGEEEGVALALREVRIPTRAEPGCIEQDVLRSTKDSRQFFVYSRWVDEAAFNRHAEQPHTRLFLEKVQKLIDHPLDVSRAYALL